MAVNRMSHPQPVPSATAKWWSRRIEYPTHQSNNHGQKQIHQHETITEKSDTEIKTDVLAELRYEPSVSIADIGVLVKDGAVTLNGYATSYSEKWNAVRATKRVAGVRAIADDIVIQLPHSQLRTDGDIAGAAANQLGWFTSIPKGAARVMVSDGWVTLEGEVEWWYQKNGAQEALQSMAGVKGVTNLITIKPNWLRPT